MRRFAPLACLALLACAKAEAEPDKELPGDYVRVIDGDTLEIRGEVVRLSNIDAPETGHRAECWAEMSLGGHATERMEWAINSARSLVVEREGKDRYGRTLARVLLDGDKDLGETLWQTGVAARWTGRQWDWCGAVNPNDINGPWPVAERAWIEVRRLLGPEEAARRRGEWDGGQPTDAPDLSSWASEP